MRQLLEALDAWPDVDTEDLRRRPEWAQARTWGWVMESGELTGTGSAHSHDLPRGIVSDLRPDGHPELRRVISVCSLSRPVEMKGE